LAFDPPPRVKSGVIDCKFIGAEKEYEYKFLKMVVKAAFSQRRKTLWNALKTLMASKPEIELTEEQKKKRAEELSVEEFEDLAKIISNTTH
jgi:16S rRNA (adenine1518-N6/adenine1519-N6)-dimethyltransferase